MLIRQECGRIGRVKISSIIRAHFLKTIIVIWLYRHLVLTKYGSEYSNCEHEAMNSKCYLFTVVFLIISLSSLNGFKTSKDYIIPT